MRTDQGEMDLRSRGFAAANLVVGVIQPPTACMSC